MSVGAPPGRPPRRQPRPRGHESRAQRREQHESGAFRRPQLLLPPPRHRQHHAGGEHAEQGEDPAAEEDLPVDGVGAEGDLDVDGGPGGDAEGLGGGVERDRLELGLPERGLQPGVRGAAGEQEALVPARLDPAVGGLPGGGGVETLLGEGDPRGVGTQGVAAGRELDDVAGGVGGAVDVDVGGGVEKQGQGAGRGERADEVPGVEGDPLEEELAHVRGRVGDGDDALERVPGDGHLRDADGFPEGEAQVGCRRA